MAFNNKNKINMGRPRPSVRQENFHVKNVVTPDTKEAARRAEARRKAKDARVIGSSLRRKSERDFNIKGSIFGSINSNVKRGIVIGLIALAVLAIGIAVGVFVFMASTSAKLSIDDEARAKLIRVQENQEYYMLFAADINEDENECPDLLMLTRVDPLKMSIITVCIPANTYVASVQGGGTTLENVYKSSGDAGLIESVGSFSEVGIAHYVKASANGLSNLIDALGGIDVFLKEYVDDVTVGDVYIGQGDQHIKGYEALTLLKSSNFSGGMTTVMDNQKQVCMGILKGALFNKNINIAVLTDQIAGQIKTDMATGDILSFVDRYSKIDEEKIMCTDVPGYKTLRNNMMVFMIDASEWKNLRTQISYGMIPQTEDDITYKDIDPSSFTIIIQNGAGVDGAGAMLADKLKNMGFNVVDTTNADSNIYKETLIIYDSDSMRTNAIAIKNSLNNGRIVSGNGLYNMHSDILIIIGADLKI